LGLKVQPRSNARLRRWDAATGDLLEEVKLSIPDKMELLRILLSPDASVLLISAYEDESSRDAKTFSCDAHNGSLREEAVTKLPGTFSPDGRYFAANQHNVSVIATASTKTLFRLPPPRSGDNLDDCLFSPDTSSLAILWHRDPFENGVFDKNIRDCVQVVALPGGHERCRFALSPDLNWTGFNKWVGNCIYVAGNLREPPERTTGHRRYAFDLGGNSTTNAAAGPLLSAALTNPELSDWMDGPDWTAFFEIGVTGYFRIWGLSKSLLRAKLHFFDPATGKLCTLFEFPSQLSYFPSVASNGRRVAGLLEDLSIEVWDIDPPNRWPWAAVAGIVSAGLVLLVGRWRSRGQQPVLPE
jgi:hypothetical protein